MLLGLPEFEILGPDSVAAACALMAEHGEAARLLAGGTDLLVVMKHRKTVPQYLVNLKGIAGLDQIRHDDGGGLSVGALATVQAIGVSPVIGKRFPILTEAAGKLGTTQIRNMGTIGGNLGNASPSAEFAPALLILEAAVRCLRPETERLVALADFFLGPGRSALGPDEIVTAVEVPEQPAGTEAIYLKHSFRRMDVSMAGAAVLVGIDGDVCRDVRIALGAVAPTPFRAAQAEAVIRNQTLDGGAGEAQLLDEVARVATAESSPIDDIRGYAEFRRRMVGKLVRRGLEHTIARCRA